jgi:DNA-nicking Smr family endonuclease
MSERSRKLDEDERALFQAAMADVAPLSTPRREVLKPPPDKSDRLQAQLARESAEQQKPTAKDPNPFHGSNVPQLQPYDVLGWKKPGVQEAVYRKLRLGQYPIEATLDLHRHTVREARAALYQFLQQAIAKQRRTLLVLHGRGERSPTPARIKSHVAHWLPQHPEVIALHSAQRNQGGTGAVYVLLRKPPEARELNRERHGVKSGFPG